MKKLTIQGRLPGLNEYIAAERQHRQKAAKLKRQAEDLVLWCARSCLRGWKATGPVVMRYTWYEPDRRRDKDNVSGYGRKVIQDALVKGGYLHNDGWSDIEGFSDAFAVDKKRPRIEVEIEEVRCEKTERPGAQRQRGPAQISGPGGHGQDHGLRHDRTQ